MPAQPRSSSGPASVGTPHTAPVISIRDLKSHCSTCSMRELCLPVGLGPDDLKQLDHVIGTRARLKKGESLYRAGEPFHALYAVRLGSLKTTVLAEDAVLVVRGRVRRRDDTMQLQAMEVTIPDTSQAADAPVVVSLAEGRCTPPVVERLREVLSTHPGVTEVHLRLTSPGRAVVMRLDDGLRVERSPSLFGDLKALLGSGAVTGG